MGCGRERARPDPPPRTGRSEALVLGLRREATRGQANERRRVPRPCKLLAAACHTGPWKGTPRSGRCVRQRRGSSESGCCRVGGRAVGRRRVVRGECRVGGATPRCHGPGGRCGARRGRPEELLTAIVAVARDRPGIAVGDAIGANITMLTLALGLAAVLRRLPLGRRVRVRRRRPTRRRCRAWPAWVWAVRARVVSRRGREWSSVSTSD